jgi:hypothetical protein
MHVLSVSPLLVVLGVSVLVAQDRHRRAPLPAESP